MRNVLIVTALVTMVFVPTLPTAAAPNDASAATKRVRDAALADCQRQANAGTWLVPPVKSWSPEPSGRTEVSRGLLIY